MGTEFCIVITTASEQKEADAIAASLLQEKLAACVQVMDISSHYYWEGKICDSMEKLIFIKAKASLYQDIQHRIKILHSYEVPEIIKVPIEDGLPAYLSWIVNSSR